ncbi:c-type cytochrome [Alteromonadaceae bacterium BrNp21-10]|nr:c-type cytochrome [Alteromonadaceae bacterium BrNp21-10]
MKKICFWVCLTLGINCAAYAAGNVEAGKAKSVTCTACHGADGNSQVDMYPKLAGQHADYITKQLQDFQLAAKSNGEAGRNDPVMNGMAAALSEQDVADLAAYYASQKAEISGAPEDVIAAGSKLYQGGDMEKGIPACSACHGPRGDGMGLAKFPDISGQHATYLKSQLEKFRSGQRANDTNTMMQDIAKRLSDDDINLLASYVAGLY